MARSQLAGRLARSSHQNQLSPPVVQIPPLPINGFWRSRPLLPNDARVIDSPEQEPAERVVTGFAVVPESAT